MLPEAHALRPATHGSAGKATLAVNVTQQADAGTDGAAAALAGDGSGSYGGEVAAMHWEQVAVNRRQLEALHTQTERQTQLLQSLPAQSGAGAPFSPPHSLLGYRPAQTGCGG